MKRFSADIDIDFADREAVLKHIRHIPASINRNDEWVKHNSGIYVNPIPTNAFTKLANIDYIAAEEMGYIKLDLLNVNVYSKVKDEDHLNRLLAQEPLWDMLEHREFVEHIIHIGNQYYILQKMPEPVNSVARMAMFIALIRPGKRHLLGKRWKEIEKSIWHKTEDSSYVFKKSHSVAYSHLVILHMNLLTNGE